MKSIEYLKTQLECNLDRCIQNQHNEVGEWCYLTVEDYKYLIKLIEKDLYKGEEKYDD